MLKQVQMMRRAGYRLQGMGSREENRQSIQDSRQLRKLSRHRLLEVPHFVIPNSFRDLGVDFIQGRVLDLGRVTKAGFSQRSVALKRMSISMCEIPYKSTTG